MDGELNSFGGSVDLGLLLQIPKRLKVLVDRRGHLVNLSLALMKERVETATPSWEIKKLYIGPYEM
jgi:hypothetical protein